ncbi:hypothetical protein [Sphingomonas profundi]|uniref:hypothetical protein n=1 Tax=Alterirhizorhabdus profundi TaxID=2681549 RepID=UPI0012E76196|nr:hypothetical protein [Sphingomonas profundi]
MRRAHRYGAGRIAASAGRLAGCLGMLMLSAQVAVARPAEPGEPAATGCAAMAMLPLTVAGGRTYRIGAVASGSSCAAANVTLTVRGPAGAVLLTVASAAADLPMIFGEATTPAAMTAALRRWIAQPPGRTMRDLPGWEAGRDEPAEGTRLFHPEPLISRTHYAELRKWGQPILCFLSGAAGEACYALDPKTDALTLLGTRPLLPG